MALKIAPGTGGSAPSIGRVAPQPRRIGFPTPVMPRMQIDGGRVSRPPATWSQRGRVRSASKYIPFGASPFGGEADEEGRQSDPYLDALREMLGAQDPRRAASDRSNDLLRTLRGY